MVGNVVLRGDPERRPSGGRQAAIVFLDAGGHGVEQQRCPHGLSGWDQRRSDVLDTLDQAVFVVGVLCTFRVLDAASLDHAQMCRRFFCATAAAESVRSEEPTSELQSLTRNSSAV